MQAPFTTPVKADGPLVCPPAPRRVSRSIHSNAATQTPFTNKFFVVNTQNNILCEVTHVGKHNGNIVWKRKDNSTLIETSPELAQVSLSNASERIVSWDEL